MGKVTSCTVVLITLMAAAIIPSRSLSVRAQALPPVTCSGTPSTTPMQGLFSGQWHSDGEYHFYALGHDVQLNVILDGTLQADVSPDGHFSGTVNASVDAPETPDEGQHDISSGYGTMTGNVGGLVTANGGEAVLQAPVILMHWGTFVGGGYTEDRYITMPDYHFAISGFDCVSMQGTIAEKDFPVQHIVNDFAGQMQDVPGIGSATGTWSLTSDSKAAFTGFSGQVDAFISRSSAILSDPSIKLTPGFVDAQIGAPLKQLETMIRKDPTIARCLLDRLGAWQTSVLLPLLDRAYADTPSDLPTLRQVGDLLRSIHVLNQDCSLDETRASQTLQAAGRSLLDSAVSARSWSDVALAARELLLLEGDSGRGALEQQLDAGLHALLLAAGKSRSLLDLARVSYALADDVDSEAAARASLIERYAVAHRPTKGSKPKKKPRPKPSATSTPLPLALQAILSARIGRMQCAVTSSGTLTFAWQPVVNADRYVVTVVSDTAPHLIWIWSGTAASASFGDTSIPGRQDTGGDGWPIALPDGGYTWTVLALNASGEVIGASFRSRP